jgi:Fe-S cluster assembly protein SufD
MATVAERHDALIEQFDQLRREPAFASDRQPREAAFARFLTRGFPTTRDEEWRFTNLAPLAELALGRPAHAELDRTALDGVAFAGAAATIVIVNGRWAQAASTLDGLPAGLRIARATHGVPPAGPVLSGTLGTAAFVDLNTAFVEEAVVIDVDAGVAVDRPIHLVFVTSPGQRPALVSPRVVIRAARQAQVSVVESHVEHGAGTDVTNIVTDVSVAPEARVDHVKLQRQGDRSFHVATLAVRLDRASTFTSHAITLGSRLARNEIVAVLDGEGAECTLNGLYVAGGDSLVDTHTTIDHARAHCPSHEVYKGILSGHARAVFNGKIVVRPDAQKTDAKQTNKALLLTDDAQINTKPQLEIFADDVKCTHGAAVGQLDEDALFYLQARGIDVADARNMLIHAFAGQVLNGLTHAPVRELAVRLVDETLALG